MATKTILKCISISGKRNTVKLASALETSANIVPKRVEISKRVKELSADTILSIWGVK